MNKNKSSAYIIGSGSKNNPNYEREPNDYYVTPPEATLSLLLREKFDGELWEPACGDGAMCEAFLDYGYDGILASDLIDRGYGSVVDFLSCDDSYMTDNIITNPPYRLAQKFVEHALRLTRKKVAMFMKLQFLEAGRRYELHKAAPLRVMYVFSSRVKVYKGPMPENIDDLVTGYFAYAWFVYDHSYDGLPTIDWIPEPGL